MLRRETLDIEGVATPVVSAGAVDDKEAVVCLHGNPGSSDDWLDLMPRVAPFSRVLAPDMPGFGEAAKPDNFDYSTHGYTRHLTTLLSRLNVSRAHLVLHDFGVAWGLSWALAYPQKLASLTLVNVGILPGYRWHAMARLWRTPVLGELSMALATSWSFHNGLKSGNPRGLPRAFVDGMYAHFDAGTKRAILRLYRATDDMGALFERRIGEFKAWTVPVQVVWGAADPYGPVHYAREQTMFFPEAQVAIFEDSGHWPHADNPQRFAGLVVPYLHRARGAR